ncbi:hypothetical protein NMY22_g9089 [Coprinellus aureogranulatus]|nr:hypothetical protein NMY22_g9089 [Coprinellus aureogranulatus]
MVFKAYSVQTLAEATSFIQDLKLGHYVKVPPRATFLVQLVATTLAAFIQVGVKQWIFDNVEDICSDNQKSNLTCPHNQVFYTASAVWGLIGPTRQFGEGSIYHYHLYAIVIGVFLPIPFWLWRRKYPNSWVKWVSTPVVLNGVSWIPPATGINYSSWFMVGVVFQYVVRKRNFAWWSKFNYVLSSALDSGTVIAVIVIFFTLQFPKYKSGTDDYGVEVKWWGNEVHRQILKYHTTSLYRHQAHTAAVLRTVCLVFASLQSARAFCTSFGDRDGKGRKQYTSKYAVASEESGEGRGVLLGYRALPGMFYLSLSIEWTVLTGLQYQVEETVFKLPRYQFVVGSEYFAKTYLQNTCPPTPQFNDAPDPDEDWDSMDVTDAPRLRISTAGAVELEGVTAEEFRVFLKLLFPIHSTSTELKFSKSEWLTILTLSTRWHFLEFRKLAIAHLDADMADPVEMITVGRREYASKWVKNGYVKLVEKKEAISEEESEAIGYKTAVRLYIVRHELAPRLQDGKDGCTKSACAFLGGCNCLTREIEKKFERELQALRTEERSRVTREDLKPLAVERVSVELDGTKKDRQAKRAAQVAAEEAERQEEASQQLQGQTALVETKATADEAVEEQSASVTDSRKDNMEDVRQRLIRIQVGLITPAQSPFDDKANLEFIKAGLAITYIVREDAKYLKNRRHPRYASRGSHPAEYPWPVHHL